MTVEEELANLFKDHGLNPSEVGYNESLGRFGVEIQAEGTDQEYLQELGGIGTNEVEMVLDNQRVRAEAPRIDGAQIPSGTVNIVGTRANLFRVKVEE